MADPTPADHVRIHPIPLVPLEERDRHLSRLPVPLTSFVGREREVTAVADLVRRPGVRLVTLTGPGGVGKTRLAIRVARDVADDYPDGIWFVALAAVRDPALVATTVAQVLGVREAGGRTIEASVREFLRDRRALLILDNVEHLLLAGQYIADLLSSCPDLVVLATSRAVLSVSGEHGVGVPPLSLPAPGTPPNTDCALTSEALRLFVERASAARSDFTVTDTNAPILTAICERLDGLPLAIELAAARLRALPASALLSQLERCLPLLTGGARDQPARLQTMRDAIAWSYNLLSHEEQVLFRRLAVFVGGISLDAAEAVCGSEEIGRRRRASEIGSSSVPAAPALAAPVFDGIVSLVEQSLLHSETGPYEGVPRFGMLETIREFGLERLEAAGEAEALRDAHAAYFISFGERDDPDRGSRLARLDANLANVRAALARLKETGDAEGILRLAGALAGFWQVRGHHREGRQWLEWALAHTADRPTSWRGRALRALSLLVWSQGHYEEAAPLAQASLAIGDQLGDKELRADALLVLGLIDEIQFRWERAGLLQEHSLQLARELGDRDLEATLLFLLSGIALGLGNAELATRRAEESLAAFREVGDPFGAATAAGYLALALLELGDDRAAALAYHEALRLWAGVGDRWWIVKALAGLAGIAGRHGQPETGAALVGAVDTLLADVGAPIFPFDRITYLLASASAETVLGEERFATLCTAGRARSLGEAIATASAVAVPAAASAGVTPARSASDGRSPTGRVRDVLRLIEAGRTDREIVDMLRKQPTTAAGASDLAASYGLSPREALVLRLIAEVKTDREIADALFLSHRTVNTHVARILAKLDVRTRGEAVTLAKERGLLPTGDDGPRR